MTRFVIIIAFIVAGYYVFRYIRRMFVLEMHKKSERRNRRYQNWEHANTEDEYRQILGVTADDDPATIRKKYKELLVKYHPDKVQHLGIEFQDIAERKTKAIMEAYEFIQRKHNL